MQRVCCRIRHVMQAPFPSMSDHLDRVTVIIKAHLLVLHTLRHDTTFAAVQCARRCTRNSHPMRTRHWRVPALVVTHCRQRSTVEGNVPQNSCVLRQRESILFVRQRIRHTPSSSVKHVRICAFVTACPFFAYALYHGTDRADRAKNGSQLILPCPGIPCFLPRVCCLAPCVWGVVRRANMRHNEEAVTVIPADRGQKAAENKSVFFLSNRSHIHSVSFPCVDLPGLLFASIFALPTESAV